MVKKQKTYSLPMPVAEWLKSLLEENKDDFNLIGINSEAKLLEVLAKNGEQVVNDLLHDLKEKRKNRQSLHK